MDNDQTPAEWLEAQFNDQWDREGKEWQSAALSADGEIVTIFHLLPRNASGFIPATYVSPGNMITLRTDDHLSYVGLHNYAAGPDVDEKDYPIKDQEELIYL
jgi:hypothetical protein